MTDNRTRPDLYLLSGVSSALEAALAARFTLHRADPPATTRAIVGGGTSVVDTALLDRLPVLEIVAIHGVGHDAIDLAATRARGVVVTTTPDVLTDDVADLAIGLMLAVQRRIVANDRAVREAGWQVPLARRASGRRIGIYGLGQIGKAIAARARPFARELHYTARTAKTDVEGVFHADIASLAAACDVLILAAPGGAATRHIVDAAVLAALGPDSILVNIARGSLVDEPALVAALRSGVIAGAGLDVFADEPVVPDALVAMEQVVLSPHQGSGTVVARADMAALVVANLDAHFAGSPPLTPL
ncbi:2-hydroxyacid dehydrogenase [Sphingomonas sp. Leaf28]|uniref:2-hydroxyacid dehydrogenase n=1 Tax=Sphingomonas sp. Leaf28 TaxID=1735695 RepID=UPI0006F243C2|nr:2-hydroxyacid dehydrogenase [Sphingomonas sp. Leaf28]KQN15822.1 dihydrofolate reductase [Sphingomonas sp. Leaf28]